MPGAGGASLEKKLAARLYGVESNDLGQYLSVNQLSLQGQKPAPQ
jgi:hypothetical protein